MLFSSIFTAAYACPCRFIAKSALKGVQINTPDPDASKTLVSSLCNIRWPVCRPFEALTSLSVRGVSNRGLLQGVVEGLRDHNQSTQQKEVLLYLTIIAIIKNHVGKNLLFLVCVCHTRDWCGQVLGDDALGSRNQGLPKPGTRSHQPTQGWDYAWKEAIEFNGNAGSQPPHFKSPLLRKARLHFPLSCSQLPLPPADPRRSDTHTHCQTLVFGIFHKAPAPSI